MVEYSNESVCKLFFGDNLHVQFILQNLPRDVKKDLVIFGLACSVTGSCPIETVENHRLNESISMPDREKSKPKNGLTGKEVAL